MRLLLPFCLAFICCTNDSQKEKISENWIQLFNGEDINDWNVKITGYPLNDNYGNTFRVEDSILKVRYDAYADFANKFGHLFYKQKYSHYLLGVEYRFTGNQAEAGPGWAIRNSGAMLHCQHPESMLLNQDFPISIEVQLLGGNGKDERTTVNLCTPGTNVVMNGKLITDHCISSRSKTYHGDQWIRVEVLVLGDSLVKHIIDKETVLEYEKPQVGNGNVANFDSSVKKDGMLLREGYIALQSESHPIEFRKVELFNLENYAHDKQKLDMILRQLNIK